ncbi:LAFE_0G13234g1_1 [Lachancea fermentati]|uniref:LAFE_0G13234g1_1 n=1 Tax=Lachancea fermentati TaxID=4955 RepID=A0A1G4MI91_LACFM|nr:LAFE_0G13234g1_1 [Lachancea fermentati]
MDWAVRTAERKTRYIQGSARSILESLNKFNEVIGEGQDKISSICSASNEWLSNEMKSLKYIAEEEEDKARCDSSEGSIANETKLDDQKTPKREGNIITHATPISLPTDDADRGNNRSFSRKTDGEVELERKISNESSITKEASRDKTDRERNKTSLEETQTPRQLKATSGKEELKSSPWSPYKAERTFQVSDYNDRKIYATIISEENNSERQKLEKKELTQSSSESKMQTTDQSRAKPTITRENMNTIKGADDKTVLPLRDRSQRRSNMFVPLPNKDPLVVQPVSNNVLQSKTPIANKKHQDGYRLHSSIISQPNFSLSLPTAKGKTPKDSNRSNVFDRLSSISTKSFEKKSLSRSPIREGRVRRIGNSFADVTGSPIGRRSPKATGHSNQKIKETLKNIFDSQIPKLTQSSTPKSTINELPRAGMERVSEKRNSLIPKLSGRTMVSPSPDTMKTGRMGKGAASIVSSVSRNASPSHQDQKPLPEKNDIEEHLGNSNTVSLGQHETHEPVPNPKYSRSIKESGVLSGLMKSVEVIESNPDEKQSSRKRSIGYQFNKDEKSPTNLHKEKVRRTSHDRLTKFQLVPPAGSKDVKKKLDKRLSEVLRTQKEQEKRKQEQLRRKTQLDEDLKKRRTRQMHDGSDFSRINRLPQPSNSVSDNFFSNLTRNTLLYDLNSTDHREIIGHNGGEESAIGDQTLPDIDSDSECEEDKILATWAQAPYLQEQLLAQQDWNPEAIFGSIPPLHIDEVFQNSRLSKLKSRQSLARINVVETADTRKE